MNLNLDNLDSWFDFLADEALDKNNKSVYVWNKYKHDLGETKKILSWLPTKLKHSVMVPVGPKALMRGKIVHTNEVLVNLGETWFVKRSANQAMDICDRRLKKCDEMLDRLTKERELIENKKSVPVEYEAFGCEKRPEIIEYVTEEEDQEWRKQHREREREYRQKLAEMRDAEKKPIVTEEDLWNHLNELELREELEDELNRLNFEDEEADDLDSNNDENTCEPEDSSELDANNVVPNKSENVQSDSFNSNINNEVKKKKQRVSFSIDFEDSIDIEPLRLEIKHSSNEPSKSHSQEIIMSPADIYSAYLKTLTPSSILKNNVNINAKEEFDAIKHIDSNSDSQLNITAGIVLPDVVARNPVEQAQVDHGNKVNSTRKISKFKASRMRKS